MGLGRQLMAAALLGSLACGGDTQESPLMAAEGGARANGAAAESSSAGPAGAAQAGAVGNAVSRSSGVAGVAAPSASGAGGAGAAGPVGFASGAAGAGAGAQAAAVAGSDAAAAGASAGQSAPGGQAAAAPSSDASAQALADLDAYLAMPRGSRVEIADQPFANVALTRQDAEVARQKLWDDFAQGVRETRADEVGATESQDKTIRVEGNDKQLRYYMARRGSAPETGWALFISMHGGGNAPASTNDSQWRNQIQLVDGYDPKDALWVAPRAPIDDWNMWFIQDIDALIERLITDLIVFENVDPNKVYINGYSAGGDGVYQLGPRMAERWAGAGMSAGHPNASSPLSLRNVAFAIHVGGDDTAYDRNLKAEEWGKRLEMLAEEDPGGYVNQWQVHAGKPHWMDLEDAVSIPFLQAHLRDPIPSKVVWEQHEYPRSTFYWLAAEEPDRAKGALVRAQYEAQEVHITEAQDVAGVTIRLRDDMLDLDAPVRVDYKGEVLSDGVVERTIATLERTLQERGDPALVFSAELRVELP